MKPCDICGTPHESWQAHRFVNTKPKPVNTEKPPVACVNADRHREGYMRDYMRVWRAVKAGRAEWLRA
jgi:hypothetical protein